MDKEVAELIDRLGSAKEMPDARVLYCLSNLDDTVSAELDARWRDLPAELRRGLAAKLVDLAEADFEVDFRVVFRVCLSDPDPQVRTAGIEGLWE